jgi:AraC-like DNA-binding protein
VAALEINPVSESSSSIPVLRFSTDALPEKDRVAAFRETYGRQILRLEMEPQRGIAFRAQYTVRALPGLGIVSGGNTPFRIGRTPELLADGNDALTVQVASATGIASQFGREVTVSAGDAVLFSNADVGSYTFPSAGELFALSVPRAALAPMLGDLDATLVRAIPGNTEALRLLKAYCRALQATPAATPQLQRLAVAHVYDLLAVALGATDDAAAIAQGRGVRAARLQAIKDDIHRSLHSPDLSVSVIASRHGITPRYLQMQFEPEGTTFSQFVRDARLAHAHRMLSDSACAHLTISAIAYESGFNDLSHFNHAFRRRYGASPSEVRAAAAGRRHQ